MDKEAYEACNTKNAAALAAIVEKRKIVGINDKFNSKGHNLLQVCSFNGFAKGVELLVKGKAELQAKCSTPTQETALHIGAREGHLSVVSVLLLKEADVNAQDAKKRTPLHYGVLSEKEEAVSQLLSFGANPEIKDYKDCIAAQYTHRGSSMRELLEKSTELQALGALVSQRGGGGGGGRVGGGAAAIGHAAAGGGGGARPAPKGKVVGGGGGVKKPGTPVGEVDFATASEKLEEALQGIIGMTSVKELLRGLLRKVHVDLQRRKANPDYEAENRMNVLFLGNPGTGKTVMARIFAQVLKNMGLIEKDEIVEVSRKDLVAEFAGQSAQKTMKVVERAMGAVLFIDEAYSLKSSASEGDKFGQEVIDTLVAEIENRAGKLTVVMAGYSKEMTSFLQTNSGLSSRFPMSIEFPNYTYSEMSKILIEMAKKAQMTVAPTLTDDRIADLIQMAIPKSVAAKGNARAVRNFLDSVIQKQTDRISKLTGSGSGQNLFELTEGDFLAVSRGVEGGAEVEDISSVMAKLDEIVGLRGVKDFVHSLRAHVQIAKERRQQGLPADSIGLHLCFTGNPGTGKTTIARLLGEIFRVLQVLPKGHLIETQRSDFVGDHVGDTALKSNLVIDRAMGGILFIDEAYALVQDGKDSFGREALDTILLRLENDREEFVAIFAGYEGDMERLIAQNPGLKSRISNVIKFDDYSGEELVEIAMKMIASSHLVLAPDALPALRSIFTASVHSTDQTLGNGRYVRNILDKAKLRQSQRLVQMASRTRDDLALLKREDIEGIVR